MSLVSIVKNEQSNLKCILEDKKLLLRFDRNYMVSQLARDLYITLQELMIEGMELTNNHIISRGNKLNKKIDEETLQDLRKVSVDIDRFDYYFKELRKDYAKKEIETNILRNSLIESSKKSSLDTKKLTDLRDSMTEMLDIIEGNDSALVTPEQMLLDYAHTLNERSKGNLLYSFGDSYLDKNITMGAAPQEITIVFGPTGAGKSAWTFQLCRKQINKKIPSVYISLENSSLMTAERFASGNTGIPASMFYPEDDLGIIPDFIHQALEKEIKVMSRVKNFFFVESSGLSLNDIEMIVKEAKIRMKKDYLILTIDLLSMVSDFSEEISASNIEKQMNELLKFAKRLNIHIIGVVQQNRSSDSKIPSDIKGIQSLRPGLSAIKNSGAWAERARVVISLFRAKLYAERYFPDDPELDLMDDIFEANIIKQNNGGLHRLKYIFSPEVYSFHKFVGEVFVESEEDQS